MESIEAVLFGAGSKTYDRDAAALRERSRAFRVDTDSEDAVDLFARPSLKPDWMSEDPAVKAAYYERARKKKQEESGKSASGSG